MGSPTKNTKKSRSRLGRGLSALVDQQVSAPVEVGGDKAVTQERHIKHIINENLTNEPPTDTPIPDDHERVFEIPVSSVVPNPSQPRRMFDPQALKELSASIVEHGLMQPIVVRRVTGSGASDASRGEDRFELIAGERRWRATSAAGRATIRAIVLDVDRAQSAQLALIENIQREDLNPIERAMGFSMLIERFAMTQEQVATRVGISRSSVANFLRLLELGEEIQSMIASGVLSTGHGKALLSCKDAARRAVLASQAADQGWSVRVLEQAAGEQCNDQTNEQPRAHNSGGPDATVGGASTALRAAEPTRLESVLRDLEKRLGEHLGTRVQLKTSRSGTQGRIEIEFYDLDQFDGLLARLGVTSDDGAAA